MLTKFLRAASGNKTGIQFVGSSIIHRYIGNTSTTVSIVDLTGGLMSTPAADDLVLVFFSQGSNLDGSVSITDYTRLCDLYANDSVDANLTVHYKFMSSTPDTSFVFTGGGSDGHSKSILITVWRGVDLTTPIDVTTTTATGTNTQYVNPPSITPVTEGAVVVSGGGAALLETTSEANSIATSSDLINFKAGAITDDSGKVTYGSTVAGGSSTPWSSGAVDPAVFVYEQDGTAFSWCAASVALRPAS